MVGLRSRVDHYLVSSYLSLQELEKLSSQSTCSGALLVVVRPSIVLEGSDPSSIAASSERAHELLDHTATHMRMYSMFLATMGAAEPLAPQQCAARRAQASLLEPTGVIVAGNMLYKALVARLLTG
jgi:hypothetical protein